MATQQQPRFVPPRFYRQYNLQNRPILPPKPGPSSPKSRSRASTFSKPSETTASTNGQLQPPSAHQRSVSMTSPSNSGNSTSESSARTPPTRPALSLILPNQTTPPDSRSPSQSHLRSASYTIGQTQGHLTPTSQPQRTISETLHTRNPTVPSIITTPVSPTDADGSPGDTRRTSNTSDAPKPAASARPRGPSLSALQPVTRETPLHSHPRSPSESTAAKENPRETAEDQAGPAPTARTESPPVKPDSPVRSESSAKSESSETSKTTTKQAPPLPSQPAPEEMAPVADLLRSRPPQIFSENHSSNTTGAGGTNSPYQNASAQPTRSSIATPTGVRSSMPEPPTQSHVQIRNSRLSFTNLKSNLSLNTLLQSQPSGYQASAPTAPSQSSGSTTSNSTAPSAPPASSTFPRQPQPVSTPLSPLQSIPVQPQFQPPNTNPDPSPHDASSLVALTQHVHTQTSQARHLFTELQHYLPFVEKQWIQSTIGDTEAAARDILLLTESMRIDQETNNGKLGLKTQFRWMMRDSRRARERRERLVLCHASLVAVLVRLEGVRAKVPEMGFPASFGEPAGVAAGPTSVPVAPVEISASSPVVHKEFEDEIPIFQSPPPVSAPPPPPKQPTATATATVNVEHTSQPYPPPPTTEPPPIPVQVAVQRNSDDLPWELPVQLQDADKELVVNLAQPPPVPPKVKIEDAYPNHTPPAAATTGNADGNTGFNSVTNGSIISGAGTDTATGTPRTMSPVSPEGSTKLDNELLDMLEWRWKQGRAA